MGQGGGGGVGASRRLMESIMYLKLQFWPVAGIKYIYIQKRNDDNVEEKYNNKKV